MAPAGSRSTGIFRTATPISGRCPARTRSPRSKPAVADFAFAHPNIALVFTFSPEDNLMEPWKPSSSGESGRIKTSILPDDVPFVNFLAEQYRSVHAAKDAPASPAGAGSFTEWAYYQYGRWSLAARGWWIPKATAAKDPPADAAAKPAAGETKPAPEPKPVAESKPGETKPERKPDSKSEDKDKRGAEDLNALAWFKAEGIDGFVDWTPIVHPGLPWPQGRGRRIQAVPAAQPAGQSHRSSGRGPLSLSGKTGRLDASG